MQNQAANNATFQTINKGYNAVFHAGKLTIGLVVPIESYPHSPVPEMKRHVARVQLAEALGFKAIWIRDVPFNVPSFGDAGQTYDPFVYLGLLAGQTKEIALGIASIILPVRHPAHIAKAAASIDVLSGGRLIMGIASGDRPAEYPALNIPFDERGARFQENFAYMRRMTEDFPTFQNEFGNLNGSIDMLPKPAGRKIPMLITGSSQQSPAWVAEHGDGWMIYPRNPDLQERVVNDWRVRVEDAGRPAQPILQPLYIDLTEGPEQMPKPIHLGYRLGTGYLKSYLKLLERIGVNHVALNLRFNQADIETTMKRLADEVLPAFSI